jgi:hypothetical protein
VLCSAVQHCIALHCDMKALAAAVLLAVDSPPPPLSHCSLNGL